MTKLQRRLLVASVAVVLFLGPLVVMGNCSGWNEGSMEAASCVIDLGPLRALANLLYSLVLLSAFILGLPILVYIGVAFAITRLVARRLRRRYGSDTAAKPWGPLLALMAAPALIVAGAVALIGASLVESRAGSAAFTDRCKAAVEVFAKAPDGPVETLFFATSDLPGSVPTDMVEDRWLAASEARSPDTGRESQATATYRRYALYRSVSGEPAAAPASQYGVFMKDLTTDADRKAGVQGAEISVKKLATDETLATTAYFTMMSGDRFCSAGLIQKSDLWVNGVPSDYSYVPFLVRALGLQQHAGTPLQPESKPARPREASTPVHVAEGKAGIDWTLIGETGNSRIYLDRTGLPKGEREYSVWRLEDIERPGPDRVASVRSRFTVDCAKRQFTEESEAAMSGPMGSGGGLVVPKPVTGPRAPVPGSAGELMLNAVCAK